METLVPQLEGPPLNPYQPPLSSPPLVRVAWFMPRWGNSRVLRLVIRRETLHEGVLFRFGVLMVATAAIVCTIAKIAYPALEVIAIGKALLTFVMILAAYTGLLFFLYQFTNRVSVYEDGVLRYSQFVINPADIQSSKLIVYSTRHILLVIREKARLHKIAVAPSVNLELLASLLDCTKIVDLQRHFPAGRRTAIAAKDSA